MFNFIRSLFGGKSEEEKRREQQRQQQQRQEQQQPQRQPGAPVRIQNVNGVAGGNQPPAPGQNKPVLSADSPLMKAKQITPIAPKVVPQLKAPDAGLTKNIPGYQVMSPEAQQKALGQQKVLQNMQAAKKPQVIQTQVQQNPQMAVPQKPQQQVKIVNPQTGRAFGDEGGLRLVNGRLVKPTEATTQPVIDTTRMRQLFNDQAKEKTMPKVFDEVGAHEWKKNNLSTYRGTPTARRQDQLFEKVQSPDAAGQQIRMKDMPIQTGAYAGSSIGQLEERHGGLKGMEQLNMRRDVEKEIRNLDQDFSDEAALRKYQLGLALEGMNKNRKDNVASFLNETVNSMTVKPLVDTGRGLADIADAATGRRQQLGEQYSAESNRAMDEGTAASRAGNKQLAAMKYAEADEYSRQSQRALGSQIESSDPVKAAGTVATAAAMPFAYGAQSAGVGAAARTGLTQSTTRAATTKIGQLIERASPQVSGRIAQTTGGKILNSTPTQLVQRAVPNASATLQAVAGESVASVLSGAPLTPAMTAQQLGSSGKLEDYLIESVTGAAIDAAFPAATYAAGAGVRYAGQGLQQGTRMTIDAARASREAAVQQLVSQGYSPMQAERMASQGGYIAGPKAVGFEDAQAAGQVFEGVDGKPRFEVDDSGAKILDDYFDERQLQDVLDHPKLYEQYPELRNMTIVEQPALKDRGAKGMYDEANNAIAVSPDLLRNPEKLKSTILHEIQHAIQKKEDFARGGSLETFTGSETGSRYQEITKTLKDLKPKTDAITSEMYQALANGDMDTVTRLSDHPLLKRRNQLVSEQKDIVTNRQRPRDAYNRLAGEAESRAVQARMDMPMSERYVTPDPIVNPKLRSTFYDSLDVPKEDLIVRQGDSDKAMSIERIRNHPAIVQLDETIDALGEQIRQFREQGRSEGYHGIVNAQKSIDIAMNEQAKIAGDLQAREMAMSYDPEGTYKNANKPDAETARPDDVVKFKHAQQLRTEIDNLLYERHPEMFEQVEATTPRLGEGGSDVLPRIHVDDLKEYYGHTQDIPTRYKRTTGDRDLDLLAQRAGYDDVDEYMTAYQDELERRRDARDTPSLRSLRRDPRTVAEASRRVAAKLSEARKEVESLQAERRNELLKNDRETVKQIDELTKAVAKEAGLKGVEIPKIRQINVQGKADVTEFVAVTTNEGAAPSLELIPLDGNKHELKNGMVVDKEGRSVGSYVGIDSLGNQYAYIEGKPVNITGILGDIDTWGNLNRFDLDMDRIIKKNAPDEKTARRVQEFTTVFKDAQEASMKAELVQHRVKLQEFEKDLVSNLPKGVSRKELTQDLFRVMEKKVPYNDILKKYGNDYVETHMRPAIEWARKDLDTILSDTNKTLELNGFDPIPRRDNYISHIQDDPNFWSKVGLGIQDLLPLGKSIDADVNPGKVRGGVPDEIVGQTANTSARRKWNPFAKERQGSQHKQDFFEALDSYYEPMLFNKYMTPAASRSRVVERAFRTFEKAKEIKFEQMAEIVGIDNAREAKNAIEKTHKNYKVGRRSPLVMAWQEYGNMLAGKTNHLDRAAIDGGFGGLVSASTKLQGVAGANTIPGSATAALAQTLSIPQTIARDSVGSFLTGVREMLRFDGARKSSGDPMMRSNFMRARYTDATSRRKSAMRRYTRAASVPMEAIERFTGELSWRSAYAEAVKNGAKGMKAVKEADLAAKATLAGRGIGDRPMAMNSKALGALTQFGLEVNNMRVQFAEDFSVGQKIKFVLAAYGLNQAYSWVTGQTPLPDYIDAVVDNYKDFTTDEKNEDGESERSFGDKVGGAGQRLLGETAKFIPGAGPLAHLLPEDVREGLFGSDAEVSRFGTMALTRVPEAAWKGFMGAIGGDLGEIGDAGLMVAPTGQQVRRTLGGLGTMAEGVSRTKSGNINTEVNNKNPLRWAQAALFGKNALPEVQGVYENNAFATNETQTDTYDKIREKAGSEAANEYLRSIKGVGGDTSKKQEMSDETEQIKLRADAERKIEKGEWKRENGLIVDKNGKVQRQHYKNVAKASANEDETTYDNWMKAYNIDGASSPKKSPNKNATLAALEKQGESVDKGKTAISLMKNADQYADMPEWVKNKYYEKAGFTKEDVEYGAKASYKVTEKMDGYWRPFAQSASHEELVTEITKGRKKSIGGSYWATTGTIDNLQKEGYLSKAEAKYLKSIEFSANGEPIAKQSSSGSGRGRGRSGRGRSGRKSSGGKTGAGGGATQAGIKSLMDAYAITMKSKVPTIDNAPSTSSMNTKKQMQKTALKQWNGASKKTSRTAKITARKTRA